MLPPTVSSLVALGRALLAADYAFVTVTPETHRHVLARGPRRARTLADVFGWNLPFRAEDLPTPVADALLGAGRGELVEARGDDLVSLVRFATLQRKLFAHSGYPTTDVDAVFFGPDTYRFCRAIARAGRRARVVVDVGCGSGAGGIIAGQGAESVILGDINARAETFARANVLINAAPHAEVVTSDVLAGVAGAPDLVVANPPYLRDPLGRTYRDGGGALGEALAVRIVEESLRRLAPGGTLLLYTGSAIVGGVDTFFEAVRPLLSGAKGTIAYDEVDPDVFGEELATEAYAAVDRIAAVLLEVTLAGA